MTKETNLQIITYFSDPKMRLSVGGRFLVRVVSYITYLVLVAAAFAFLISAVSWLRYLGALLGLFLIDRLIHRKRGERPLSEVPNKGQVNLARYLKPSTLTVLEKATDKSSLSRSNFPLEVLRQLLGLRIIREGLLRMNLKLEEIRQKVEEFLKESAGAERASKPRRKEQTETLVVQAFELAVLNNHKFIEPGDLFSALTALGDEYILRLFNLFSIDQGDLERALLFSSLKDEFSRLKRVPLTMGGFIHGFHRHIRHRVMNRAWTSRPTPILDRYSVDLTDLARKEKVGFLVGHKEEYNRMVDTLARPINPNALLVGEEGIGKETLVAHLAFQITKDKVPAPLFDKRLVSLELSNLLAGADPGGLQGRLQAIVDEIMIAGNVILYIPEIHNLVRTSGEAYLSAADALVPVIRDNAFPVIGSTYPREFKEFLEPRSDLVGIFETIQINEIIEEEAERLLVYGSLILEYQSKILISFGAIKMAVKLAKRYFRNRFLPGSADELLKSALTLAKRRGDKILGPEAVIQVAEASTKIPIQEATQEESEKLLNLEDIIHQRLINQDEAVGAVSQFLREYRSGLTAPGKPIASFLFVGPTGVGKTELSKILAGVQFGAREMMVRFDMTEYQDKQSFYRFIGSPDREVSGALTDAVMKRPYGLILLDEFEKAYPDILDLFLQVFDDGRLTDNLGRTASFEHTIIIATSNAHSDLIIENLRAGKTMAETAEYLRIKLVDVFKPELLNRFSKIVIFNNLSPDDLRKIVVLKLGDFREMVKERGIELEFESSVVKEVAKQGYDPAFGARPLDRVISEMIKAPLAKKILTKELVKGSRARVVFEESGFEFVASQ